MALGGGVHGLASGGSPVATALALVQSLSVLPLIWAAFASLEAGTKAGWARLRKPTYRRLNRG